MLPDDGALDSVLGCFASRKFRIKPMGKRGSAVTCGSPGPLPDPGWTYWNPAFTALERTGSGVHGVPAGPIHPDRAADGAGVTGVRYGARAADRTAGKPPAPMVPV